MKVGITGEYGFIGTNLRKMLDSSDHVVSTPNSFDGYRYFIEKNDVIVHLAGVNRGSHDEMMETNVNMTLKIADLCYKHKKKLIYMGSKYNKKDSYALTKQISSKAILSYVSNFNCNFFVIEPPLVVGEGCIPFYNSFITTMVYQHANGDLSYRDKIENYDSRIEFVWVDDLCETICNLIDDENAEPSAYNFIHTKNYISSLSEIIEMLEGKAPKSDPAKIRYQDQIPDFKKFQKLLEHYRDT